MIQPATAATSTRPTDARVVNEQLNVVEASKQPKPINAVIRLAEPQPSELPLTELPYRTRVDYKTEDDVHLPVSHASDDHVTAQPRSHGTSGQHATSGRVISMTSPSPQDAMRIQIGDPVDRDKRRSVL